MEKKRQISFDYSALSDSILTQAKNQGFDIEESEVERLEKIKEAINMCYFHVATESQVESMFDKLHKKVMKSLIDNNKE